MHNLIQKSKGRIWVDLNVRTKSGDGEYLKTKSQRKFWEGLKLKVDIFNYL